VFQVLGNFSLLITIDRAIFGDNSAHQWFSVLSALSWVLYLTLVKEAPQVVRMGSLLSITLGFYIAQTICLRTLELYIYAGFGIIWMVFVLTKGKIDVSRGAIHIFLLLVVKNILGFTLLEAYRGSISGGMAAGVTSIYFLLLFLISLRSDRSFGNQFVSVIYGTLVGQVVATVTDSSLLYIHSCAFTATLLQGLAHGISREQGTMQRIQDYSDHTARVAYEYAHVVYFPNLLLQAVHDVFMGISRKDTWKPC